MLIKTSYFEPLRHVESDFKFVQFFYTRCIASAIDSSSHTPPGNNQNSAVERKQRKDSNEHINIDRYETHLSYFRSNL